MNETLQCWKCGASLAAISLPLGRRDECPSCHAELHVCRLCRFFDTRVAQQCREPMAEDVRVKERANFCGYFVPRPDAYRGGGAVLAQGDRSALDALFAKPAKKD